MFKLISSEVAAYYLFNEAYSTPNFEFDWTASLLFGATVSATDPVAVVSVLKTLGASKKLATVSFSTFLFTLRFNYVKRAPTGSSKRVKTSSE